MPSTVLVIDDDDDIRWVLGEILADAGYQVALAGGGADGLARLVEGLRPDLVLLDLMMPGMNGWQFRAAMRRDPAMAEIPVVIMSGGARVAEAAMELGAAGWLAKPFELHELVAAAREHTRT